jgi:thioredoxin-dependent peroxiredoxin
MPEEGDKAPDFELMGVDGMEYKLSDFKGRNVVLYFYPKDDTTGCTIEAKDFSTHNKQIEEHGAIVLGVSGDSYESHCDFRDKYGLNVMLLSDPDMKAIKEYDAYGNKGAFGEGILRTTFVIDKKGKIVKVWKRVHAEGHVNEVMDYLKGMGK